MNTEPCPASDFFLQQNLIFSKLHAGALVSGHDVTGDTEFQVEKNFCRNCLLRCYQVLNCESGKNDDGENWTDLWMWVKNCYENNSFLWKPYLQKNADLIGLNWPLSAKWHLKSVTRRQICAVNFIATIVNFIATIAMLQLLQLLHTRQYLNLQTWSLQPKAVTFVMGH